jgi:drug/metabolite transporter (DMT)-like permease
MNTGKRFFVAPLHIWSVLGTLPLPATIALLVLFNLATNLGATIGFALSGQAGGPRAFILWQIAGGLMGLGAQLTFAGLVRFGSVQVANAVGIGLAFAVAQVAGALWFFGEPFGRLQWLGTALVIAGVLFIAFGKG